MTLQLHDAILAAMHQRIPVVDDALVSADGVYRYWLTRGWAHGVGSCTFIGLNPSTAGASKDDPTVRRLRGYAADWGYQGFCLVNLFAFRSTDPKLLREVGLPDVVGPDNDAWLQAICRATVADGGRVVAVWGSHPLAPARAAWLRQQLEAYKVPVLCFGTNADGQPKHPLYLRQYTPLERYWRWE